MEQALEHGRPALELARGLGNPEQLAFVLNDLGRLYTNTGDFESAFALLEEAQRMWLELDNKIMLADCLGATAGGRWSRGDYEQALALADEALKVSRETDNAWGQSYSYVPVGYVHLERGEPDLAIRAMSECIRLGDLGGLIASSVGVRADLALVYGNLGDLERGIEITGEAMARVGSANQDWKSLVVASRVRLHLLRGDLSAAVDASRSAPDRSIPIPFPHFDIVTTISRAELALADSEPEAAMHIIEAMFARMPAAVRGEMPNVLFTKARALVRLERLDEAREVLGEAKERSEALGSRNSQWQILGLLAELETRRGNPAEAEKLRRRAGKIVLDIAARVEALGLRESFLAREQVKAVLG
jgi:tetratricopeptide (TPR) repeat protein